MMEKAMFAAAVILSCWAISMVNGCASAQTVTKEHELGQVKAAFFFGWDEGFNRCLKDLSCSRSCK